MPSYLITGSSRGIGLGLVEALLKDAQNFVIATARNPTRSEGLQQLSGRYPVDRLAVLTLDVTVPEQIASVAKQVGDVLPNGLDYLIHNAGYWNQQLTPLEELDVNEFEQEVKFYTVPVVHLLRDFKSLVLRSTEKKVVFIGASMASFTLTPIFGGIAIPYCVGKAAQTILARKWGIVNKSLGITTVLIHPGVLDTYMANALIEYVQSNMDPNAKMISVEESVSGVLRVMHSVTLDDAATYWTHTGETVPW
ncbi:NAD(P)-binding protein [Panus rudis PR-1116 ss-1]|nr:NAD(P)-binding protein [Panus rudis PR-1116 ss-1]